MAEGAELGAPSLAPKPNFVFPTIQENPSGWGPCEVPEAFKDTPYQPFSKDDRLGKVADWSGGLYQDRRTANKYGHSYGFGGQQYVYHHEQDESSFQLVDTARIQRPPYRRPRMKFNQQKIRRDRERREERRMGGKQQVSKGMQIARQRDRDRLRKSRTKRFGRYGMWDRNPPILKPFLPSVQVKTAWVVVEEIDFSQLAKLSYTPDSPEELHICGMLGIYDGLREKRIGLKAPQPLNVYDRIFHKVTTTDDPIIRNLSKRADCKVFATDTILATLMTAARSRYSWDIVAQRVGDFLFFDKRDDSQFDFLTVSETAKEPPQQEEGINCPTNLAVEATYINQNFSQQILMDGPPIRLTNPNPFAEGESGEVSSVAYRYLKWKLRGGKERGDVGLVARCEYDAVVPYERNRRVYINIKALNEWDPKLSGGVDWRKKLESQRGAVFATELKNNSCKIAKWALCALLAESHFIKFGYVSRVRPGDSSKHEILGVQQVKPAELAQQMTLDVNNAWGVLHAIIGKCLDLSIGKYVLLKDPNKSVVRIYHVPDDTFENNSEGSDSEESEAESESDEERGAGGPSRK